MGWVSKMKQVGLSLGKNLFHQNPKGRAKILFGLHCRRAIYNVCRNASDAPYQMNVPHSGMVACIIDNIHYIYYQYQICFKYIGYMFADYGKTIFSTCENVDRNYLYKLYKCRNLSSLNYVLLIYKFYKRVLL